MTKINNEAVRIIEALIFASEKSININEIIKKKIIFRLLFNFVIFAILKAKTISKNFKANV